VNIPGVVESFDEDRGDGWVLSEEGERFYFHCVSIGDGSRQISVGARVLATRHVGHVGRDEVVNLRKVEEESRGRDNSALSGGE
jgi:cold shock CspA family protein